MNARTCLACERALKGRSDKKFCNDYCRNNYNNVQKAKNNYSPAIRNINNALLKNRKVLGAVLAGRKRSPGRTGKSYWNLDFVSSTLRIHIPPKRAGNIITVMIMATCRLIMTGS